MGRGRREIIIALTHSPFVSGISCMNAHLPALFCAVMITAPFALAAEKDTRCFEMRTYYAAPGKLDELNARFRDHTCKLFEKHGLVNIGYWVPVENPENKLIYILASPNREARDQSWKNFQADPDWKAAHKASEVNGKLVANVDSRFLTATDYSPAIKPLIGNPPRTFELRTYTASTGNLNALNSRFRDHTVKLFSKHGMDHVGYWTPTMGQKGADSTLIYILAHGSKDAADASFKSFRADPEWIAARKASEKDAGGSLTAAGSAGVQSIFMKPTDYSQTK
jgi:hypothetical protein